MVSLLTFLIALIYLVCAPSGALAADWGYETSSTTKPLNTGTPQANKDHKETDWGYDSPRTETEHKQDPQPVYNKAANLGQLQASSDATDEPQSIPASLSPGRRFELSAVTNELHGMEKEVALPFWLGGQWQCQYETKYPISGPLVNGVRHTRNEIQTYGVFDDNKGWIYLIKVPNVHKIDEADFVEHRVEVSREFPVVSDTEVVTKYRFYAVQVSKFDGLIVSTRVQNSSARITPLGRSEIQITGALVSLDTEGNKERSRSVLRLRRVAPGK